MGRACGHFRVWVWVLCLLAFVAYRGHASSSKEILDDLIKGEVRYKGQRVSLDLKEADLPNVLRLFSDIAGVNVLVTDDVKGRITLRLMDVPWDQALDIILKTNNLGMEWVGNVIRISTLERLQKEKEARAKTVEAAEIVQPVVTELIPVSYGKASDLLPKAKELLSPKGGITVDERTNTLIVKDIPERIERIRGLVSQLDSQTPQVLIDAKIVEATTDFRRELGISWGGRYSYSQGTNPPKDVISGGSEGTMKISQKEDYLVNLPAAVGLGAGGAIDIYKTFGSFLELEARISALESKGLGEVISSPRVVTLDHTEAYIEQGIRIPYLKYTTEGTVSTEFIDATLKLTVTPHVTADGHVKLDIECAKETPDWSRLVQGQPTVKKSRAKTQVMVKDGEVIVLGGIYEYAKANQTSGVPLLKDMPLLGWLFKSKAKSEERKELLIFISPKIVTPLASR